MNKKLFWPTILVSLIFFINQLTYLFLAMKNLQTYMFVVVFVVYILLFVTALFTFLRYLSESLNTMERISVVVILISIVLISCVSRGVYLLVPLTTHMGELIILLGIVDYFQSKHKINKAFILWGLAIILWHSTLYL